MDQDDVGATDSRLRHVGPWMLTRFAEAGLGLDEGHEPTLERERGVRCHDHVPRNWRAHDEGVDFVGAACFSNTQRDLVDAPCALLYQLMWTSKGEFDASGPHRLGDCAQTLQATVDAERFRCPEVVPAQG